LASILISFYDKNQIYQFFLNLKKLPGLDFNIVNVLELPFSNSVAVHDDSLGREALHCSLPGSLSNTLCKQKQSQNINETGMEERK